MSILKNNMPIGFFDSGVGGLTVLKEVKKMMPNENFVYFGDTLHVPYGDKTKKQLLEYSKDILNFFNDFIRGNIIEKKRRKFITFLYIKNIIFPIYRLLGYIKC